ncbi:MAG: protease inhibitor I42 family protein [Bacteroidia bacterium]
MKNLLSVLILVLINFSCSYKNINAEAPIVNEVKLNEKFKINLPENHTDGYTWQQKNISLKNINELSQTWRRKEKGIDFNYQSIQNGVDTLIFVKRKHTDTLETKKFIIKVIIN